MSIRAASKSSLSTRSFAGNVPNPGAGKWVRHPAWLSLTAPTSNEEKFVGLHAVWPDSNFISFQATADYTVDWGDGVTENYASAAYAYHEYSFSDSDLANTNGPVTLQGVANTVTRTAHGFNNGQIVSLYNITTTTGINEASAYYVVNASADTFQISEKIGGTPVDFTNDGSATLLPYKQAIVTITPQAGQQLTSLNLNWKHNKTNLQTYNSGFLDIAVSGANLLDFRIGSSSPSTITQSVRFNSLERVNIVRSNIRQANLLLYSCKNLQRIENLSLSPTASRTFAVTFTDTGDLVTANGHGVLNGDPVIFTTINSTTGISTNTLYYAISVTANTFKLSATHNGSAVALTTDGSGTAVTGTSTNQLFGLCSALTSLPSFDTSSVISAQSMFSTCYTLKKAPLLDMSNALNLAGMFNACYDLTSVSLKTSAVVNTSSLFASCQSIREIPLFDTSKVTTMATMFQNCYVLEYVPLFDTGLVTDMTSMFQSCYKIKDIPTFNTASVTSMVSMFQACYCLTDVPHLNTVSVTSMNSMFNTCPSLLTVPPFNTNALTSCSSMFAGCSSLMAVPTFNTTALTTISSMFQNCYALDTVPALSASSASSTTSIFSGCNNLANIGITGVKYALSVASAKLSKTALENVCKNLGPASGGSQTLTITGNHGIDTAVTKTVNTTARGATVSMADTSGLSVGMIVTGTGTGFFTISTISADVTTNEFTLANHGLPNGTRVAFPGLSTVTGLTIDTIYYVVNATTNTFQVSATAGGSVIDLTGSNSASVFLRYECYIASINPNVSITLTTPAASTQTSTTLTFRLLDSGPAWLRSWTVTY